MKGSQFRAVMFTSVVTAVIVTALWWSWALVRPLRLERTAPPAERTVAVPEPSAEASAPAPATTPDEQINIRVYKTVSPGVVNITSRTLEYDFFLEPIQREGSGSGSVIDYEGNIVTNYHVVREGKQLEVTLLNELKPYSARLVGSDPVNDLAVIRIQAPREKLHPVKIGDSSRLQVGQRVLAIGNPFRLQGTLTTGVVSALDRELVTQANTRVYNVIQTDASINHGNSGGPLLNAAGEMIGVNTMIFSPSGGSVGIGFAIPSNTVKRIVNDLVAYGQVRRIRLGIRSDIPLTPELAEALDLPPVKGVLVIQVEEGSPAAEAGIRGATQRRRLYNQLIPVGGDIITALNGKKIAARDDIRRYLEERKPGDTIRLTIIRDGRTMEVPVPLTSQGSERRFRF